PTLERLADQRRRVGRFHLGEEPEPTHFDAEDRRPCLRRHVRTPEERPVAADGDHEVDVGGASVEIGAHDPVFLQRGTEGTGGVPRRRSPFMDHEDHRGPRRGAFPSPTAASTSIVAGGDPEARCTGNSTLPAGPGNGEAITFSGSSASERAVVITSARALRHTSGSRMTPPRPTCARPASNCGFTRTTEAAPRDAHRASAGSARRSEMKERSATTTAGMYGSIVGARSRTFVRSITVTRGSIRRLQASGPSPTSTAITRAAPRWRRQSVNPPVEAPASRQSRPPGSTAKRSSAAASLPPARDTKARGGAESATEASAATSDPALVAVTPATVTLPAFTASCAWDRLAASPRRTSSASRRRRPIVKTRYA